MPPVMCTVMIILVASASVARPMHQLLSECGLRSTTYKVTGRSTTYKVTGDAYTLAMRVPFIQSA